MRPENFILALGLPESAILNERIAKKLLVENGAARE